MEDSTRIARRAPLCAFLGLLAVVAACAGRAPRDHGVTAVQFKDVVVPDGMTLRDGRHESHSLEEGSFRLGHFEYHGRVPVAQAAAYVKERMEQHSWELISEKGAENRAAMVFEREPYRAEYTIQRTQSITEMVVDYRTEAR